jgi:Raf kinase inhibitor-like YbhB/YbcL family protein
MLPRRRFLGNAAPRCPNSASLRRASSVWSRGAALACSSDVRLDASAFKPGADIPTQCTCDGADISPALSWSAPPAGTQCFVLMMEDPDAPGRTWVHWLLYNLPARERELPEGVAPRGTLPSGARHGRNDFGRTGYGGPCPPPGSPHRYYFRLFALDSPIDLKAGATRAQIDRAMKDHVLGHCELMGRYRRG